MRVSTPKRQARALALLLPHSWSLALQQTGSGAWCMLLVQQQCCLLFKVNCIHRVCGMRSARVLHWVWHNAQCVAGLGVCRIMTVEVAVLQ